MNITYTIIHVVKLLAGQVKSPTCQVANKSTCRQWSSTSNPIQQQHASLRVHSTVQIHQSAERPRFCARSLASCIPRSSEDRSLWMFFIQVVSGRPGGRLQFSGGGSKMAWLASAFSCNHPRRPTCPVRQTCTVKNSAIWLCCWPADHRCRQWLNYRTRSEASERGRREGWRWQWHRGSGVGFEEGASPLQWGKNLGRGLPRKCFDFRAHNGAFWVPIFTVRLLFYTQNN